MNFNRVTNELEFVGCVITELQMKNEIFNFSNDLPKSFGLDVKKISISKTAERKIGEIILDLKVEVIGNKNEKFLMDIEIEGVFSTAMEKTDDQFMQLLYVNGVAAMLGIARGKIEALTANLFNAGKISIPFVNVLDYYKDITKKKENKKDEG